MSTLSITWMIPFFALMLAFTTLASLTKTAFSFTEIATDCFASVSADPDRSCHSRDLAGAGSRYVCARPAGRDE